MNNVMVFAVHPDDETLGCGGTILKHKKQGDRVAWTIITEMAIEKGFSKERIAKRQNEIMQVSGKYDFDRIYELAFPAAAIDEVPRTKLVSKLSQTINDFKPNILYIPFKNDVHSDHRVVFEAVLSCSKSFRYHFIKKIYMMEILSESEFAPSIPCESFTPNYFVDISEFFAKKIDILKLYESELGEHPFPRSLKNVKALSIFRGAMVNCDHAESFMLLKEIN